MPPLSPSSSLSQDEAFSSKDHIAKIVKDTLQAQMKDYG
jgi:hypothetical protein